MREVRIPAQCAPAQTSNSALSSDKFLQVAKIIPQDMACQPVLAANYCDHSPSAPKLFIVPATHKPRAKIVQETSKKLAAAYDKPKTSLNTLQFHNESGHQVRSQRREAAIALLQVMNYYQDDATGRVGRALENGGFRDMTLKALAQKAGIVYSRAKRALKDIFRAGYMKVTRQFLRNPETGEIRGIASIRSFLPKFFTDLDMDGSLWTKWFSQRGWAQQRAEKKTTKEGRKKARALVGLIKEQVGNMGSKAKSAGNKILGIVRSVTSVSQKEIDRQSAYKQKMISKSLELFRLDPSKSPSEYYAALKAK